MRAANKTEHHSHKGRFKGHIMQPLDAAHMMLIAFTKLAKNTPLFLKKLVKLLAGKQHS
jgi:hypothetical protein